MQEFSSISVSSYEAGALADRLTEQAGEGWSVVAIVPTGSTVTAYLSREDDGSSGSPWETTSAAPAMTSHDEATDHSASDDHGSDDHGSDDNGGQSSSIPATSTTSAVTGHDTGAADPVSEAPGWATGSAADDTRDDEAVDSTPPVASTPTSTPAESTPADAPAPTSGAAPAGWYADPSSRFELRYWDGGQWTEHVSRSGQQYTDPPIA